MSQPDPEKHVQQITQQSGSNFSLSFLFLSKEQKKSMTALYAFCRVIDDIVDQNKMNAQVEIDWWRNEIKQLKKGKPHHPISVELLKLIQSYQVPTLYFDDLLKGVEMDLHKNRYQTFEELYDYCYHVASVVGLIALKIFGTHEKESELYAINLGIALQLTNILRDVDEDLERGRIYLPQEDLHLFDYSDRDLHHRTYNQAFLKLMRFQTERAKEFYRVAEGYSLTTDWKNLGVAQIMSNIYYALLEEIEQSDFSVFEKRITLSKYKKAQIALTTFTKNRFFALVRKR